MTITARYAGKCRECGGDIEPGEQIEWERSAGAKHLGCPERQPTCQPGERELRRGEGYGGRPYEVGQTLRVKADAHDAQPAAYTVVRAWADYVADDGMSFGVGDESGHIYYAVVRPATSEEEAELVGLEQAHGQRKARRDRVAEIYQAIRQVEHHRDEPVAGLDWLDIPHDRQYSTAVPHDAIAADPATGLWARTHEYDWGWHYWCAPYDQALADELVALLR